MSTLIRILTWNAHGWANKFHLPNIQQLFQRYDILLISEAWVRHAVIPDLTPPNFTALYTAYPEPLQGRVNGGLIVYYRNNLTVKTLQHSAETWKPIIWISVANLIIAAAYLPHEHSNYLAHWEMDPIEELYSQADRYPYPP